MLYLTPVLKARCPIFRPVDARPIDNDSIRDGDIQALRGWPVGSLIPVLTNGFTSAKFDFFAVNSRIHPSRTESPTVGPYIDTYSSLPMSVPKATSNAPGSTVCPNPFCTNSATMPSIRCDPTTPDASLFPPVMIFAPDMAHSMTFLESLDSERAAVPAATSDVESLPRECAVERQCRVLLDEMVLRANLRARHAGQLTIGAVRSEPQLGWPIPVVRDERFDALAVFLRHYSLILRDETPGRFSLAYEDGSWAAKMSSGAMGRKEPYSAASSYRDSGLRANKVM